MSTISIFRAGCTSRVRRDTDKPGARRPASGLGLRPIRLLLCAALLVLLPPVVARTYANELKIYRLNYREPEDLIEGVRQLLSPYGKASVDERTRSLLVIDNFDAQQRIEDYIIGHDILGQRMGGRLMIYAGCGEVEDEVSWEKAGGGWLVGYDNADRNNSAPEPETYNLHDSKFLFYQGSKTRIEVAAVPDLWLLGVVFGEPGRMQRLKGPGRSYLVFTIEPGGSGFGVDIRLEVASREGNDYHALDETKATFNLHQKQRVLFRADLAEKNSNTERITMQGGNIGHLCFSFMADFQ